MNVITFYYLPFEEYSSQKTHSKEWENVTKVEGIMLPI